MYPINNMLGDTSSQSSRIYTPYSPPSYSPYSLPPYSSYPHQPPACNDVCPVKRNEDQNSTKNTCSVIGPIVNVAQCVAGALLGNPSNCIDQRRWGIAVISTICLLILVVIVIMIAKNHFLLTYVPDYLKRLADNQKG